MRIRLLTDRNRERQFGIPFPKPIRDNANMTAKKATTGKVARSAKGGFFIFHGIKIAAPGKPKSKAAKVLGEELHKRSEARGERKSA